MYGVDDVINEEAEARQKFPWYILWLLAILFLVATMCCQAGVQDAPKENVVSIWRDEALTQKMGTGFIMEDGVIVTAKHVIMMVFDSVYVRELDGDSYKIHWTDFVESPLHDLALLRSPEIDTEVDLCVDDDNNTVDNYIYLMGFPLNTKEAPIFSQGRILTENHERFCRIVQWPMIFTSTAYVAPGHSGSPVFDNETDELVGVLVGLSFSESGIQSIIVSTEALREFLDANSNKETKKENTTTEDAR